MDRQSPEDVLRAHGARHESFEADVSGVSEDPSLWEDSGSWAEADIPARPWLAQSYLMRRAVTVVAGPGGVSKSSLMVAYAVALAFGLPCHRMVPGQACRVVTYNVEDDRFEQRRRFSAALRSAGRSPSDLDGRIIRVGPQHVGTLIQRSSETNALMLTSAMNRLLAIVRDSRADVLILDPLIEVHTEDENDNTAMREIMARLRTEAERHDIAIIAVHHTRKGVAAPGDPDSLRGASAVTGAARVVLTMVPMSKEDAVALGIAEVARRHYVRLDGAKANYAAVTETEWFQRLAVLLANGDSAAVLEPWTPPEDVVTLADRHDIEAGIAAGHSRGPWSARLTSDERSVRHLMEQHGVTTRAGQKQLLHTLAADGITEHAFTRADNGVRAKGLRMPDGQPVAVKWVPDGESES